jgi:hypothetical protein
MGVLLGMVLFTVFLVSEFIQYKKPGYSNSNNVPVTSGSLKKLVIIYAASLLALLINPHGIKTYFYVYSHLQMKMISEVYEWYSPFNEYFKGTVYIYTYYIFILLTLAGLYLAIKQKLIFPLITLAVFLLFSFRSTRYSIDFMLIASIFLIYIFSNAVNSDTKNSFFSKPYLASAAVILFLTGIILTPGNNLYKLIKYDRVFGTEVDNSSFPVKAAQFLKENNINLQGYRVFNSFDTGGFLIWEFNGAKNFIDSRNLNDDIYFTYKQLNSRQPGFEEKFKSLNFDIIFLHFDKLPWNNGELKTSIISYLFRNYNSFKLVYWDDDAYIFVRNDPKFSDIINKFEYKYVNPYFYIVEKEPLKAALSSDPLRVTEEIKRNLMQNPNGVFIQAMAKSFNVKL